MEQEQNKHINVFQPKTLPPEILAIAQKPQEERSELETDILLNLFSNTQFFQRHLDSQLNFEDFMQKVKHYINYERYPSGAVLLHEGQHANKLCIILKGTAAKYIKRPMAEIEQEAHEKQKNFQKEKDQAKKINAYEAIHQISLGLGDKHFLRSKIPNSSNSKDHSRPNLNKSGGSPKSPTKRPGLLVPLDFNDPNLGEKAEKSYSSSSNSLNDIRKEWEKEEESDSMPKFSYNVLSLGSLGKAKEEKTERKLIKKHTIEESFIKELEEEVESDEEAQEEDAKKKAQLKKLKELQEIEIDTKLFQEIVKKVPTLAAKYFLGDIFRLKRIKEYLAGQHFGENFLKSNRPKENLLVALEEIHLLTITRESYANVISFLHTNVKEKMDFFVTVFPPKNEQLVKNFAFYFKEKTFQKGEKIYAEDDIVDCIYLIHSGQIGLFKKIEKSSHPDPFLLSSQRLSKPDFPVAVVTNGQFFGEELLLKQEARQYTALSKAFGTKVYFLEAWVYNKIKNSFSDLLSSLRTQAKEKLEWRQARIQENMGHIPLVLEQINHSTDKLTLSEIREKANKLSSISPKTKRGLSLPNSMVFQESPEGALSEIRPPYIHNAHEKGYQLQENIEKKTNLSKNLMIYKEKFCRQTFMINDTIKKVEEDRRKVSPLSHPQAFDLMLTPQTHKKKTTSLSNVQLPSMTMSKLSLSPTLGPKDSSKDLIKLQKVSSLHYLDVGSSPNLQNSSLQGPSLKNIRPSILQCISPSYMGGSDEILKHNDLSPGLGSGRSNIRKMLKNFDKLPDLTDNLYDQSEVEKMLSTNFKFSQKPSNSSRLKSLRKPHVIKEHFKPLQLSEKRSLDSLNTAIWAVKINTSKQKV